MIEIHVRGYQIHFIGAIDQRAHKIAHILKFDKVDNMHLWTDVRKTSMDAVFFFIKDTNPALLINTEAKAKWAIVSDQITKAYEKWKLDWLNKYDAKNLYSDIDKELMKHQLQCVWTACYKQFNLFALAQGTGKTLTAASISKLYNVNRTLIICPNLVKWNWMRDLSEEFGFDGNSFTIYDSKKTVKAILNNEKFVVVNFEGLPRFKDEIKFNDIGHIIIDECHKVKSTKTATFKNVKEIVDSFPKARVTLLSGTPITNRITDLFAYLNLCHIPIIGSNIYGFTNRYAKKSGKQVVGIKNADELRGLLSNFMIRKRTKDCIELPELRTKKYYISDGINSESAYKTTFDEMIQARELYHKVNAEWEEFKLNYNPDDPQQKLKSKRYRKEVFNLRTKSRSNFVTLNRLCALSKVKSTIKLIDGLIEQQEKVIVFSGFREPLNKIRSKYLHQSVYIDGSVPALKRQEEIEAFKKDKNKMVFIAQVVSGGIGINLVNSSKMIFLDLPVTPDKFEQAQKRAHRKGQVKDVDIMIMILENSIDERVFGLIKSKGNDISKVLDDGNAEMDYNSVTDDLLDTLVNEARESRGISKINNGFQKVR